jgi:hypothetical protein
MTGLGNECRLVFGPVVQDSGIEIGAIWPGDRFYFRVEGHVSKQGRFAQRAVEVTVKHGFQVYPALAAVIERQVEHIGADDPD